jgi:bifunctional non-homologous end joining protein LigD
VSPAEETSLRAGRRRVRITNPDRLMFPRDGITKLDLATYYRDVAPAMVRHARDRPVALQRYNDGIEGQAFFQQEMPRGAPDWVRSVRVRKEGGWVRHALANDAATLVWLANQNCITPHVWTSRADRLERPDRMIVDLDPSGDGEFPLVKRTALELADLLRSAGCEPFTMTTGSRGMHVVVPLRRTADFARVFEVAQAVAEELVQRNPDELTTAFRKSRREGRLFVDVLRNRWAQTAVAPYAVRPRPGAPVATPVRWEEVERLASADRFRLRDVLERLDRTGDPWERIAAAAGRLPRV